MTGSGSFCAVPETAVPETAVPETAVPETAPPRGSVPEAVPVGTALQQIALDDPRAADVRALLERHLAFSDEHSPPEDVYALDVDGLLDPALSFFSLRRDGELLGIGALKEVEPGHAELKSMHTAEAARGQGVARAMVGHLLALAGERGYERVSLETGSMAAYAPARALYAAAGFAPCGPFAGYPASPNSTFMTLSLGSTGYRVAPITGPG
jgi:putative acetyltransferase